MITERYPHIKLAMNQNYLKMPKDSKEVKLSFPAPDQLEGWKICSFKQVSSFCSTVKVDCWIFFTIQMITREEIDLPDQVDIEGLDYPPYLTLGVFNEDPSQANCITECQVQIVGFQRKNLKIKLNLTTSKMKTF